MPVLMPKVLKISPSMCRTCWLRWWALLDMFGWEPLASATFYFISHIWFDFSTAITIPRDVGHYHQQKYASKINLIDNSFFAFVFWTRVNDCPWFLSR
jgi:hypothetical protein